MGHRPTAFALAAFLAAGSATAAAPPLTVPQLLDICASATVREAATKGDKLGWAPMEVASLEAWRSRSLALGARSVKIVGWRRGTTEGEGLLSFRIERGTDEHRACSYSLSDPGRLLDALSEHLGKPVRLDRRDWGTYAYWRLRSGEASFSQVGSSAGVTIFGPK